MTSEPVSEGRDTLVSRLLNLTIDWNGSAMADEADALTEVKCGLLREAAARIDGLEDALKDVTAHLVAAHSLLSRSPKTAAPSDRMFDQMLRDYNKSFEHGRAALAKAAGEPA